MAHADLRGVMGSLRSLLFLPQEFQRSDADHGTNHYGNFDLAQVVFAFSLAYAIGQFAAGALGDRFGGRFTGAPGGAISAASTAGMAAVAGDRQALLVLQIVNGLGQDGAGRRA